MSQDPSKEQVPDEFAFYYPGHLWERPAWLKNLLLFFDGIALLVPEYKMREPETLDPELSNPLLDQGLLRLLPADKLVNKQATVHLAGAMAKIIRSGALDQLAKDGAAFHQLSYSRLGGYGDAELADAILGELRERGLAGERKDELTIPMHPKVRVLVLVLLSQILRSQGGRYGLELSPATDRPEIVTALGELLSSDRPPVSKGTIVSFDLQAVGVDLDLVPLDEVLDFRRQHLKEHRRYARDVRKFARELSLLPEEQRIEAFSDRKAEIEDIAAEIRKMAKKAWKQPITFGLSLAGAAWNVASGNVVAAVLSAAAATTGLKAAQTAELGAYSYLFKVQDDR